MRIRQLQFIVFVLFFCGCTNRAATDSAIDKPLKQEKVFSGPFNEKISISGNLDSGISVIRAVYDLAIESDIEFSYSSLSNQVENCEISYDSSKPVIVQKSNREEIPLSLGGAVKLKHGDSPFKVILNTENLEGCSYFNLSFGFQISKLGFPVPSSSPTPTISAPTPTTVATAAVAATPTPNVITPNPIDSAAALFFKRWQTLEISDKNILLLQHYSVNEGCAAWKKFTLMERLYELKEYEYVRAHKGIKAFYLTNVNPFRAVVDNSGEISLRVYVTLVDDNVSVELIRFSTSNESLVERILNAKADEPIQLFEDDKCRGSLPYASIGNLGLTNEPRNQDLSNAVTLEVKNDGDLAKAFHSQFKYTDGSAYFKLNFQTRFSNLAALPPETALQYTFFNTEINVPIMKWEIDGLNLLFGGSIEVSDKKVLRRLLPNLHNLVLLVSSWPSAERQFTYFLDISTFCKKSFAAGRAPLFFENLSNVQKPCFPKIDESELQF